VKFHGAFRDAETRSDFLVGQIFEDAFEDFLLAAAQGNRAGNGAAGFEKLPRFHGDALEQAAAGAHHHLIIVRRLAAHQTVHGEKAGCFFQRKGSIGARSNLKAGRTCFFFAEDINLGRTKTGLKIPAGGFEGFAYLFQSSLPAARLISIGKVDGAAEGPKSPQKLLQLSEATAGPPS